MNVEGETVQAMRNEIARLKQRVEELDLENDDLRAICGRNGICVEEPLSARRHRRYFARLWSEHPVEERAIASGAISKVQIYVYSNSKLERIFPNF